MPSIRRAGENLSPLGEPIGQRATAKWPAGPVYEQGAGGVMNVLLSEYQPLTAADGVWW